MGSYGSTSHFKVESHIDQNNSDIVEISKSTQQGQRILVETYVRTDDGQPYKPLMMGDLDSIEWDFDRDTTIFTGRDFGGRLVDERVVLKDSQYVNMKPSQIAKQFAADVGMTPDVPDYPGEQSIGYLGEENMQIRVGTPITKWSLLVTMAKLTGRSVLVKPGLPPVLFFGVVDINATPKKFIYGGTSPDAAPIMNLRGEWKPYRNSSFMVVVLSYHPETMKQTMASVVVAGETLQYETSKKIAKGMYKGAAAGSSRVQIGEVLKGKPSYVYYAHGKTPQECQDLATQISKDIAKREFIMHGTVLGDPTLNVLDTIMVNLAKSTPILLNIDQGDAPYPVTVGPFEGREMFINSLVHHYSLHGGFTSTFSCWDLRSASAALSDLGLANLTPAQTVGTPIE